MRPWFRSATSRAFTLIEIMVAVVIFTIVLSALYMSFRTATRAYVIGINHNVEDQYARFAVTQMSDDLRNVFFRSANAYNTARRQRELQDEQRRIASEQLGAQVTGGSENQPELGPAISLSFVLTDSGELDELSFVRLQSLKRGESRQRWSLARVRYYVSEGNLIRALSDISLPETDEEGNPLTEWPPEDEERIARDVKSFDVKAGYWHDGEWLIADDWDSGNRKYRNPLTEEEEAAGAETWSQPQTRQRERRARPELMLGDPSRLMQQQQTAASKPTDELPAWIEFNIVMGRADGEGVDRVYRQVVMLPSSQETYVPPLDEQAGLDASRDRQRRPEAPSADRGGRQGPGARDGNRGPGGRGNRPGGGQGNRPGGNRRPGGGIL